MATYFLGVDFGTIYTKACIRNMEVRETAPVILNETATGAARYLWPSAGPEWSDDSPKVLLCREHDIRADRENRALSVAADAVTHCIRRALLQIDDSDCEIIVQLGLPTRENITDVCAAARYELIAEDAIKRVGDRRLRRGHPLLDERLAALALLHQARFEFANEPLMVIDGGGWTTHASFLRWVSWPEARMSIHGSETVMHGVQDVVRQIARSLRLADWEAERALHDTVVAAYRSLRDSIGMDLRAAMVNDAMVEISSNCARAWNMDIKDATRRIKYVLDEFVSYVEHRRLEEVWETAWRGGWSASRGEKHYSRYRLFLLGGASRIGRTSGVGCNDPIARRLGELQRRRTVPFTNVVYPEINPEIWTLFSPQPEPEAVPYLFVAGGYTWPLSDWPEQIRREAIGMQALTERPHYDYPESEPG